MSLTPGTRLGPYEITAQIGEGGMGQVFRATDTKLKRQVAIKILPPSLAADHDRLARFQREAEVLASLNHPNIAAIYGLEDGNGVEALVMELVEGEDLSQRTSRGAIPLDDALPIAKQIAEALEAAHEQGIIHRDLKPANIKVRSDGTVKVLDFGLAKAMAPAPGSSPNLSQSPTITTPAMTHAGMILGTAAYMSPEQARGEPVDKRTDIWAFGCVFYEMLTGRAPFAGNTISDTIAAILEHEPDWNALSPTTPPTIRRLVQRCLAKVPKRRLRDVGDARIDIDEAGSGSQDVPVGPARSRTRERFAWIAALVLVTLVAGVLAVRQLRPVPPSPEMRLEINTPPTEEPISMAISPDGQQIVFTSGSEGQSQLWLRSLDAVPTRPLPGTNGARYPFFSPDGRAIGFFADGKLKRLDVEGGSPQTLADAPSGRGGTWNRDGTILFAPSTSGPLFRVADTGVSPVALTRLETSQQTHRFPQFLPSGRHFLYYVRGSSEVRGVYLGQVDGSDTRRLLDADSAAVYAPSGHLLFVRQGTAFAQAFDVARMTLTGNPFPVAENVAVGQGDSLAALSTSATGSLVYRTGSATQQRRLVWFDRSGKEVGAVGNPEGGDGSNPSLSPNGRRLAVDRYVNGNFDIWLLDSLRGGFSRFTSDLGVDMGPLWSPDGSRIVFNSSRTGVGQLYQKSVSGAGSEELLLDTPQPKVPADWAPDGRFLLYRSIDPKTASDLWVLPFDGDRPSGKPFPVAQTNYDERDGQFSPDGKWIAYQSDDTGRSEIYVQPFPERAGQSPISTTGGAQVRWRHDGKELFYIALDGQLMAVLIQLNADGRTVNADVPVKLFPIRVGGVLQGERRQQYLVSPDGQRFLVNTVTEEASTSPITVILNWKPKQ